MKKNNPFVSIITASYNYEKYISQTIESVINQTYTNWEMIIVDDGSSDNSIEIIKSYCKKDSRIKLLQHKNGINKGLKDTILLGIKEAKADWIAFCESDDYYAPNHLEEKIKIINENNNDKSINLIFNDYIIKGNQKFKDDRYYSKCQDILRERKGNYYYKDVCCDLNPIATFSIVMLRKSILKKLDFNSPDKPLLDYYLWAQLTKRTKFYYLDMPLSLLNKHEGSYITCKNKTNTLFYLKLSVFLPQILIKRIITTLRLFKLKLLKLI